MSHPFSFVCAAALLAGPVFAAEKDQRLSLPLPAGSQLTIDAGAGFLKVEGREGQGTVEVHARIDGEGMDAQELEDLIRNQVKLTLEKTPGGATLKADVRGGNRSWFSFGRSGARIDLTVTVPKAVRLSVHDGSGALELRGIQGDVDLYDGSGELIVEAIHGNVKVEDGSGGILIRNIQGNVKVDDGSGSMELVHITGSVTVDDGSGSIDIDDVGGDVHLKSTGSGGVSTRNVKGRVIR